jgi:uncharacterized cofD-like protein
MLAATAPVKQVVRALRPVAAKSAAPLRVVAVGGGTGLPALLGGLALLDAGPVHLEICGIVTTCDDGGSSGKIRRSYGLPSPGDIRNCLVALAGGENALADLFQHRFEGNRGLGGHTVGNVVLAALAQRLGDFCAAVEVASTLLGIRGQILPSVDRRVELVGRLTDGRLVRGESAIARSRGRIDWIALQRPVPASPRALEAIANADLVVLGPGSLYTSIIASVLPRGMREALAACRGRRVLVVNLFTQPGETDGYDAADHVRAVQRHLGSVIDVALVHSRRFSPRLVAAYAMEGARPVRCDRDAMARRGVATVEADLLAPGGKARHDPRKLGNSILEILRTPRMQSQGGTPPCVESSATSVRATPRRCSSKGSVASSIAAMTAPAPRSWSSTGS